MFKYSGNNWAKFFEQFVRKNIQKSPICSQWRQVPNFMLAGRVISAPAVPNQSKNVPNSKFYNQKKCSLDDDLESKDRIESDFCSFNFLLKHKSSQVEYLGKLGSSCDTILAERSLPNT